MKILSYPFDERKTDMTKEALKNYFLLNELVFLEETTERETGWIWITIVAEKITKDGMLKNHLTTVSLSKLSDTLLSASYGIDIKIPISLARRKGLPEIIVMGPLIPYSLTNRLTSILSINRKQTEKAINEILKEYLMA